MLGELVCEPDWDCVVDGVWVLVPDVLALSVGLDDCD